ncbi:MarR family transcriptional regulator [Streptomyces sp. NBC_01264]|uniref:MarR family transcriptional regulator n=1 Tax=Streptomyces sp. NBC_01264 TaxID=2903804 RepID=UPI0022569BD4|nr:MarR family transcriptional regulator [Streptomyces sp. NBC_01264]MCX4776158.1 MarR family transcriptional regulator [Streptomyces sp. NBC_01264]
MGGGFTTDPSSRSSTFRPRLRHASGAFPRHAAHGTCASAALRRLAATQTGCPRSSAVRVGQARGALPRSSRSAPQPGPVRVPRCARSRGAPAAGLTSGRPDDTVVRCPEPSIPSTTSRGPRRVPVVELLEALWRPVPDAATGGAVPPSQLRALTVIEQRIGINLKDLGEALGSAPPAISRLCDRLEAAGLIQRTRAATNRREIELSVSRHGRAVLEDTRACGRGRRPRFCSGCLPATVRTWPKVSQPSAPRRRPSGRRHRAPRTACQIPHSPPAPGSGEEGHRGDPGRTAPLVRWATSPRPRLRCHSLTSRPYSPLGPGGALIAPVRARRRPAGVGADRDACRSGRGAEPGNVAHTGCPRSSDPGG